MRKEIFFCVLFFFFLSSQFTFGFYCDPAAIQNAIEKTDLRKCPEKDPAVFLDAIIRHESGNVNCAPPGRVYTPQRCVSYCDDLEKKGIRGYLCNNRAARLDWCQEQYDLLQNICKEAGRTNCPTTPDFGMGPAQIQPSTWPGIKSKAASKGIVLKDPWDLNQTALAAAVKLTDDGFCTEDICKVIHKYNGCRRCCPHPELGVPRYVAKIFELVKEIPSAIREAVGAAARAIAEKYEELRKKLEEMWNYKRQLELTYPEILGIKLPTTTVEVGIEKYLSWVIAFLFQISALILFGVFVYGSIKFLIAGENVLAIEEAKRKISSAFVGVLMLLSLSIVIHTLKPEWVGLKIPPIKLKELVEEELQVKPEGLFPASELRAEIPVSQAAQKKILSKEEADKTEKSINEAQSLLQKFEAKPSIQHLPKYEVKCGYEVVKIYSIADLAKCLMNATTKCSCGNMQAICTKVWYFSLPVGCSGDPCKEPNGKEPRLSIDNIILNYFPKEIENLKKAKEKLAEREEFYRRELNILIGYEREIENCASQRAEFFNVQQYLSFQRAKEEKIRKEEGREMITGRIEQEFKSFDDALTFVCPVGGKEWEQRMDKSYKYTGFSCPIEIKIGDFFDKIHQFGIFMITKLRNAQEGIKMMGEEISNLISLVSECNRKDRCKATCACIPNPCFCKGLCPPTCATAGISCCPCTPKTIPCCVCIPLAGSPCLQAVGSCVPVERDKNPCDRKAIEESVKKIKIIEDEVLNTLEDLKRQKEIVLQILGETELVEGDANLANIRKAMQSCTLGKSTFLLNWEKAFRNIGHEGPITFSNSGNLFCCYFERGEITPEVKTDIPPIYAPPVYPNDKGESSVKSILQKYLQSPEKICDEKEGFKCGDEVKEYKQYNEASKQLMEFLACFKYHLGNLEKEKEIEKDQHFGKIVAISDPKLYGEDKKLATFDKGETCSFIDGPKEEGGCSHPYELEKTTKNISCHYGGRRCREIKKSFAVDISFENFWERKYIEDIIRVAKECDLRIKILPESGQAFTLHFSVGQIYGCNCQ